MTERSRTVTRPEVQHLLAICEAADDQDTGSLDAFREAASVGVVAALCREVLAQGRVIEAQREALREIAGVALLTPGTPNRVPREIARRALAACPADPKEQT